MATKNDGSHQTTTTPPYYQYNQNDTPPLGPRKTIFVLATVVACIAILFPKIFYPMMFGGSEAPIKNAYINKDMKVGGELFQLIFPNEFYQFFVCVSYFNEYSNVCISTTKRSTINDKKKPKKLPLIQLIWLWRMLRSCARSWKVRECYSASWSIGL